MERGGFDEPKARPCPHISWNHWKCWTFGKTGDSELLVDKVTRAPYQIQTGIHIFSIRVSYLTFICIRDPIVGSDIRGAVHCSWLWPGHQQHPNFAGSPWHQADAKSEKQKNFICWVLSCSRVYWGQYRDLVYPDVFTELKKTAWCLWAFSVQYFRVSWHWIPCQMDPNSSILLFWCFC